MSTNCEAIKPLLTDFALQEISKADADAIHGHLERCPGCRQELDETLAMLGLLQRAEVTEELPRNIRVVAQPSPEMAAGRMSWWSLLWGNAGRLAFAGGALSCLAIGLLGISQASISYGASGFQLSFGGQPVVAPVIQSSTHWSDPVPTTELLSVAEVEALVARTVQASELRQKSEISGLIRNTSLAADERRSIDLQQMAETFRYMQAAQTNMWKEQMQSQQIVAVLAQKNGLSLSE